MTRAVQTNAARSEPATYQVSSAAWPERGGDRFADWVNSTQKYVVPGTLSEPDLTWEPTTIIRAADLTEKITELRAKSGGDIYVYGSLTLVRRRRYNWEPNSPEEA